MHQNVATAAAGCWHAFAFDLQNIASVYALRNMESGKPVQSLDVYFGAKQSIAELHIQIHNQIITLFVKNFMFFGKHRIP